MQCLKYLILWIAIFLYCFAWGVAQDESGEEQTWIDFKTRQAIERGLTFLVSQQNDNTGDDHGSFGDQKYAIAVTSFACLALLADGNVPGRGRYGTNVANGLDFILRCVSESGYITRNGDESRMHGHGYAMLFLAEVYGMSSQNPGDAKKIRDKLLRAIAMSKNSQTSDGGWGYEPTSTEHEGSVTVVQVQALRACRNAGLIVSKSCIDNAVEYVRRSANPDGSFKYRLGMAAGRQSFPLSAAGVSSLNATGEYESKEIQMGLKFMMDYLPPHGKNDRYYQAFYYYGHFYAAQAMYHAPSSYWEKWFPAIRADLLSRQDSITGAWGRRGVGFNREPPLGTEKEREVYTTAIAILVLQIPYNYLPIFQK